MSLWIHFGHSCAVTPGLIHAAKTPQHHKGSRRKTHDTACGKRATLLAFGVANRPADRMTVSWPPYVDDAREWGYERCRDCMTAVPGRPKRPPFAKPTEPTPCPSCTAPTWSGLHKNGHAACVMAEVETYV